PQDVLLPGGGSCGFVSEAASGPPVRCAPPSLSGQGVQRTAGVQQHLVEFSAECRVGVRHAGEPQSECDLAGGDEVIQVGQIARQRPVLTIAIDKSVAELSVVGSVSQFPQRDGDVVEPIPESAVVKVDDLDVVVPEQRIIEVQVGVDQADGVSGAAE